MRNLLTLLLSCIVFLSYAQNQVNTLTITPVVFEQTEPVSDNVKNLLKNKMMQVASKYGFASGVTKHRHIMFPDIQVFSKNIVPSAPPKVMMVLEITFYIADYDTKTIYASKIFNLKGVGSNETKAYFSAVKQLNINNQGFAELMETGKQKIIHYYNNNCGLIIKQANNLADQDQYEEALAILARIPSDCADCYNRSLNASKLIYDKYEKQQCLVNLAKAKSVWYSEQNYDGALKTEQYLSQILPGSSCYREALQLEKEIKQKIEDLDNKQWNYAIKKSETDAKIEEARIKAISEIAIQQEQRKEREYNRSEIIIVK
jgi:hypothetical protein